MSTAKRLSVLLVTVLALSVGLLAPVYAWWTSSATATATVTAGTLQPPTNMTCSGAGLLASPTLAWTAPTGGLTPNQYTITYRSGSATATPTTVNVTGTSWQMPSGLLNLLTTYYISVQSSLQGTSWVSVPATSGWRVSVTGVVGLSALTSCVGTYTP